MFEDQDYEVIQHIIRQRRTWKMLARAGQHVTIDPDRAGPMDQQVRQAVADAGWAPFHYDRKLDSIAQPWRCHILWQPACRHLAASFSTWFDGVNPQNKYPPMLAACGALVLVTWLPQSEVTGGDGDKLRQVNEEHLAATAALVQNLLLLLTARNMRTYWSSGGLLRQSTALERLGIDPGQRLLAAVFVHYDHDQTVDTIPGNLRNKRAPVERWVREIREL